tara:strand:+ start:652 stop:981 length:330 start_codon:yes stop_codon:yes gene_type:complete
MQEIISKLSGYAALVGVIGVIGGGFMAWGEFQTRLSAIENKEFVVNETVDLSGVNDKIEKLKDDVLIENRDLRDALSDLEGIVKINEAGIEFLEAMIEEMKAAQDNPLL